ncbi:hypothetical protein NDU88_001672 [Pleurodeles waltl]|uniref:Uncharacterized protein n=1 Tax=Pleurodeles waltl TaxID=8319 RepID=A0AAV7Q9G7_PLEWA|nr:hypothetical protein NDU88_001672 [Pleurodeles waltl]
MVDFWSHPAPAPAPTRSPTMTSAELVGRKVMEPVWKETSSSSNGAAMASADAMVEPPSQVVNFQKEIPSAPIRHPLDKRA